MADVNQTIDPFNTGLQEVLGNLPSAISSKLETILSIGKILLIILIIYFAVLIISKVLNIMTSRNIKSIANSVENINEKMDILIKDKSKKIKK